MSTLNVFSWIWIAAFCEIVYRILLGAFKSPKKLKDAEEGSNADQEKANEKINFEINPRKKKIFHRRCGRGLAGLAEEFKSMCGMKTKSENSNTPPEDPLVKDGLKREDKFVSGGNIKISSYYDNNGKMVFQRETILPPPTIDDIKNSPQGSNNPSFYIKPQDASSTGDVKSMEQQVDKTFGKIYGVGKELADSQKNFVDEHVNKTFKDIYDMVLPSVF